MTHSSGSACTSPTLADLVDIAAVFELDEFAVEDAAKGGQRAKLEQYGGA